MTVHLVVLNERVAHTCLLVDQLTRTSWLVALVDWASLAINKFTLIDRACLIICVNSRVLLIVVRACLGICMISRVRLVYRACLGISVISRVLFVIDRARLGINKTFRFLLVDRACDTVS